MSVTPGKRSRSCSICGTIVPAPATRCPKHPKVTISSGPHRRMRAQVLAEEHLCWICGKPAQPNDPLTYDHLLSRADGGDNSRANARAAHGSCNSRRGQSGLPCAHCTTPSRCLDRNSCQPTTPRLDRRQRIQTAKINQQTLPPHGPKQTLRNPPDWSHLPGHAALVVLCGAVASGKTTLSRQWAAHIISVDEIRRTLGPLDDHSTLAQGYQLAYEQALRHLRQGQLVVFDSTATTAPIRRNLLLRAQAAGATAHLVMLDTPSHVAQQRNAARPQPVPAAAVEQIQRAYHQSQSLIRSEPWETDTILGSSDTPLQA